MYLFVLFLDEAKYIKLQLKGKIKKNTSYEFYIYQSRNCFLRHLFCTSGLITFPKGNIFHIFKDFIDFWYNEQGIIHQYINCFLGIFRTEIIIFPKSYLLRIEKEHGVVGPVAKQFKENYI